MTDHLKPLPIAQVAAWYRRLAQQVSQRRVGGKEPYSAILLRHYLDNRDKDSTLEIESRNYLQSDIKVIEALKYHRQVFLSEKEARVGSKQRLGMQFPITKLGGIVPRLKGLGYPRISVPGKVIMEYESLVQVGDGPLDILRIQQSGRDAERDLFTSLRGFQLHSKVLVRVADEGQKTRVHFESWMTHVHDRYDWNYDEYLTMPNPDFGSKASNAVRPQDQSLTVYHTNAKRLEDAKLAAPYNVRSTPWSVINPILRGSALV